MYLFCILNYYYSVYIPFPISSTTLINALVIQGIKFFFVDLRTFTLYEAYKSNNSSKYDIE